MKEINLKIIVDDKSPYDCIIEFSDGHKEYCRARLEVYKLIDRIMEEDEKGEENANIQRKNNNL